jgi:hypothetical protein
MEDGSYGWLVARLYPGDEAGLQSGRRDPCCEDRECAPHSHLQQGAAAARRGDPDRTATVRATMFTRRDRLMREILDRAAARGEIRAAAVTPQVIGLAPALVDHHFLIHGAPIPDEVLTGIVDNILLPLLTAAAA